MRKKLSFEIFPINNRQRQWVKRFIAKEWGSEKIVVRGQIYYPHKLNGFLAVKDKKYIGLITYDIDKNGCHIITLNSIIKNKGIGTALVEAVREVAIREGCKRMWLITTNDNLDALRFWQRRGFVLKKIYPNAIAQLRKLKPEIPKVGEYGISIRDEIELERMLNEK